MNKYGRRKLSSAVRRYCCVILQAVNDLESVIDEMKTTEEDKFENLPESLKESPQGTNLREAAELCDSITECLEMLENNCYELADCAGTELEYCYTPSDSAKQTDSGPRRRRFQILLSDQMFDSMKSQASQRGISCNELICQALKNELQDDTEE